MATLSVLKMEGDAASELSRGAGGGGAHHSVKAILSLALPSLEQYPPAGHGLQATALSMSTKVPAGQAAQPVPFMLTKPVSLL
jgi:hypothetical protein